MGMLPGGAKQVTDVGVIDEIQLLADADRGWAWTRALFGLPAREARAYYRITAYRSISQRIAAYRSVSQRII